MFTKSHFDVFFMFLHIIYVYLSDTAIKGIFFFVCLFFFLTITGRNEAITVAPFDNFYTGAIF